jgi:hypothetical protein
MVRLSWLPVKKFRLAWHAARNMSIQDSSGRWPRRASVWTMDASLSVSTDWLGRLGWRLAAARAAAASRRRCSGDSKCECERPRRRARTAGWRAAAPATATNAALLADHLYAMAEAAIAAATIGGIRVCSRCSSTRAALK